MNLTFSKENWREAVEISTIPRISYTKILGMSLTKYLLINKYKTNDELLLILTSIILKPENTLFLNGINPEKAIENLKISLSARRAEQRIYN